MQVRKKYAPLVVFLMFYFFCTPLFWGQMPITVTSDLPSEWNHDKDLPITITVRSWNNNFRVTQVRFFIDNQNTKMTGAQGPIYPFMLMQDPPIRSWNRLRLNWFTLPFVRRYKFDLPFESMKSEGKCGPGLIVGKIDVQVDHVGSIYDSSSVAFDELNQEYNHSVPFRITLK
jgi:hypothetical protein